MKKILLTLGLVALLAAGCEAGEVGTGISTPHYPEPTGYVVDTAKILDFATTDKLTQELKGFDATAQIAVATIPSLEGVDIETYSIGLAEKWKVGHKTSTTMQVMPNAMSPGGMSANYITTTTTEADNGIIFLVAVNDHKMRIEVGRGLEGKLTDAEAGRILDNTVRPLFKAGDYNKGVLAGVDEIIKEVK